MSEREYDVCSDIAINEMANLFKNTTKLPLVIYISDKSGVVHSPRIKVNTEYYNDYSGNTFTITVENNPRVIGDTKKIKMSDIEDIKDLVILNKEILLQYWEQEIDIVEFSREMKTL